MIIEIRGTCEYEDCDKRATQIACGRDYVSSDSQLGCYCDMHADMVADEGMPEYHAYCPNCGCEFGVN